jgi:hypothetical protein
MSATELRIAAGPAPAPGARQRDEGWLRAARRARQLSWASLAWMSVEGVVGLVAGLEASSLSLVVWAASSFVEGLASMTIIWRFTGSRVHSATSERTAQRWVAGRSCSWSRTSSMSRSSACSPAATSSSAASARR